ncbi:ATP-dependent RNA helicase [Coemansia asiatica]|nr:ATP-dependent RNA helicase [Coemansia asiatica]
MSSRRSDHHARESRTSRYTQPDSQMLTERHRGQLDPSTHEFRSAYSISKLDRQSLAAAIEARSSGHLMKPLLSAAIDDDLSGFLASMRALNVQSTVTVRFSHGLTPLIVASKYNAVAVARWICTNDKISLECKDTFGNTALHHGVAAGSNRCVAVLLDAGAQPQSQNAEGATPVHFAAYHGNKDAIQRLLAELPMGTGLRDNTGKTPLMLAAFRGRTHIVSILLTAGAPVNAQDKAGWTALMYAAFTGRIAICRELLEFSASRSIFDFKTGRRAEDLAHQAGYYEVVDMLQNKEVSLRTPSLPEGVYMPRFRPISRTGVASASDPSQRDPLSLRPVIERALSPTPAPRPRRSQQRNMPAPIKPPPIPVPSPKMSRKPSSADRNSRVSGLASEEKDRSLGGLNIVLHSSAPRGPSDRALPSTNARAHTGKKSMLAPIPESPVTKAAANLPFSEKTPVSAATPSKTRSAKPSSASVPVPPPRPADKHRSLYTKHGSSSQHAAAAAVLPEQRSLVENKKSKKRLVRRVDNTHLPNPVHISAQAQPVANAAPTKATKLVKQRKTSIPPAAGPLHTPIVVAPEKHSLVQPGSGWIQSQHRNQRPSKQPSATTTSAIAATPLLPTSVPIKAPLSIPERIRDTVSRASLKYLDSRTTEALRHDAVHQHTPASLSSAEPMSETKYASPSVIRKRRAGSALRKRAAMTSPYKRYHDSSWIRPYWRAFSLIVTLWMPNIVLNKLLKKETPEIRQAWREKIALCLIIVLITALTALVSFGLSSMFCHPVDPISLQLLSEKHGANSTTQRLTVIRGRIFNVSNRSDAARLNLAPANLGHDSSSLFAPFPEESRKCNFWPKGKSSRNCYSVFGESAQCASSNETWNTLRRIRTNKWVVYQWNDVLHRSNIDKLFVYNEHVFSLKPYLASVSAEGGYDEYFGHDLTETLKGLVGTDATIAVSRDEKLQRLVPCWESQLRLGRIEGSTVGCVITSSITISVTVILNIMILIKLICAVLFDWAFSIQLTKITKHFTRGSGTRVPHVLITITCYDENEDTLRATLDSVAMTNYACSRKIMFIIADGEVEASGDEGRTTPQILRSLVVRANPLEPVIALPYIAIGEGPREFNAAEVIPGSYISLNGIHVPCILVVKVGTKRERDSGFPKAGNRGKRDSQLIVLQWLRNVLMNDHLTPLEFELCRSATQLAKINPDQFEYLLMVDADTSIDTECIPRLVAAMERDPGIMGLCGETRIANKRDSWVTRIQVYEYYISHHLSKAFESLWGGVTCLPGCCSMYRVFSRKPGTGSIVPLLVAPEVIEAYSSNDTVTLHQKNLLLLGEDRYLTTVLLRAFPKRKLIYVPRAICRTTVPDKFSVLVSQRRRWINSTIHNLLELILVRDLCGTFCCSMQFLVLMDLLGNVVLPASVIFSVYLIFAEFLGYPVALPLLLMALAFALQGAMILVTTQRVSYIYWMLIYILAIPLWNFVMPIYAFWRFDDFSWGKTRMLGPEVNKADFITDDERLALEPIPLMRWKDWIRDNITIASGHANGLLDRGTSTAMPKSMPAVPQVPVNMAGTNANLAGQAIGTPMPAWPAANLPTPIARLQENAAKELHERAGH